MHCSYEAVKILAFADQARRNSGFYQNEDVSEQITPEQLL